MLLWRKSYSPVNENISTEKNQTSARLTHALRVPYKLVTQTADGQPSNPIRVRFFMEP